MRKVTIFAECGGNPYILKDGGERITITRKSEFNEFIHKMVFEHDDAINVFNAAIDLIERGRAT